MRSGGYSRQRRGSKERNSDFLSFEIEPTTTSTTLRMGLQFGKSGDVGVSHLFLLLREGEETNLSASHAERGGRKRRRNFPFRSKEK